MKVKDEAKRQEVVAYDSTVGKSVGTITVREDLKGNKVSLLGYGAMRLPTIDGHHATGRIGGKPGEGYSAAEIDQKVVNEHVDFALEHGVNYFDTSPAYCRGESERVMGIALSRHPRERYFIATKLSNFAPQQYPIEASKALFENSLKALRTDYIDYYLLHAIGNGGFDAFSKRYIENGAIDWLLKERSAGRIRNLGFSFHGDHRAFEWCIERHDQYHWDFCQIQMNYVDWLHAIFLGDRVGRLIKRGDD